MAKATNCLDGENLARLVTSRFDGISKLKQKDLPRILGTTPSRISETLNGKRDQTMDLARALYKKLNVDPKLILSE